LDGVLRGHVALHEDGQEHADRHLLVAPVQVAVAGQAAELLLQRLGSMLRQVFSKNGNFDR
jgi:hypothetical protein